MTWWQTVLAWIGGLVVVSWAALIALVAAAVLVDRHRTRRRVVDLAERFTREAAQ